MKTTHKLVVLFNLILVGNTTWLLNRHHTLNQQGILIFLLVALVFVVIYTVVHWERHPVRRPHGPTAKIMTAQPGCPELNLVSFTGPARAFSLSMATRKGEPERITMAAICHPDGTIYAVSRPGRHQHCLDVMREALVASNRTTVNQGFVTSAGRYVSRQEACLIARNAGQLVNRTKGTPYDTLFSEDLWD